MFGASNQTLKLIIQGEIGYATSETCTTNNNGVQTWIHEIVHSWKTIIFISNNSILVFFRPNVNVLGMSSTNLFMINFELWIEYLFWLLQTESHWWKFFCGPIWYLFWSRSPLHLNTLCWLLHDLSNFLLDFLVLISCGEINYCSRSCTYSKLFSPQPWGLCLSKFHKICHNQIG